jgi:hypothetical protein
MYQVAETGTLAEVLAVVEEGEAPWNVADALGVNDRDDLLQELLLLPEYKEAAEQMIGHRKWMADAEAAAKYTESLFPWMFRDWQHVLKHSPDIGILNVCFPSRSGRKGGSEWYVAISGDGLWLYHFEVLSFEGDGQFRLTPHLTGLDDCGKKVTGEGQDSQAFRRVGGCEFGDVLTGPRILEILTEIYSEHEFVEGRGEITVPGVISPVRIGRSCSKCGKRESHPLHGISL